MRINIATQILLELNQTSNTILQSPSSSPPPNDNNNNIFNQILIQLNEWLAFLPNLIHSLIDKLNEAFSPEARAHWLELAKPYVIPALGVVLLCLLCCCCLPVIFSCIACLAVACWSLIRGFFMLLWGVCRSFFSMCCCCGRRSIKMMKAPGRGGRLFIPRVPFESNPSGYFRGLRAGKLVWRERLTL